MARSHSFSAVLAALVACGTVSFAAGNAAPSNEAQTIESRLFAVLDARPIDCPDAVAKADGGDRAACAETDLAWGPVKKRVRKFVRTDWSGDLSWETGWGREGERRVLWLLAGRKSPRKLVFDPGAGWIASIPGHPCFESSRLADLGVVEIDAIDRLPELDRKVPPEFPEAARERRAEGHVLIEAILEPDGTVGELCVVEEAPEGLGFAEAAAAAVSSWRYTPAEENGTPVGTCFTIYVAWSFGPG